MQHYFTRFEFGLRSWGLRGLALFMLLTFPFWWLYVGVREMKMGIATSFGVMLWCDLETLVTGSVE